MTTIVPSFSKLSVILTLKHLCSSYANLKHFFLQIIKLAQFLVLIQSILIVRTKIGSFLHNCSSKSAYLSNGLHDFDDSVTVGKIMLNSFGEKMLFSCQMFLSPCTRFYRKQKLNFEQPFWTLCNMSTRGQDLFNGILIIQIG